MPSFRFTAVRADEIDYRRPDATTRTLTLADVAVPDGDPVKIAVAWQALIQAEIDKEERLDSLPLDDPERNFKNLSEAQAFFASEYPAGNVFIEKRTGALWRITRNEVVSITWDVAYDVKVSTVG